MRPECKDLVPVIKNHKLWAFWAAATVFFLFFLSYAQNESRVWDNLINSNSQKKDFSLYDFAVYYVAGKIAADEKSPTLYYSADFEQWVNPTGRLADPATHWAAVGRAQGFGVIPQYIYPPFFALAVSPLAYAPPRTAYFIWRQINLALLLLSVLFTLLCADDTWSWPTFLLAAIAALSFFPYRETSVLGQVGCSILLLWTLGVYFVKKSHPGWSAACFALGTIIKLTPVLVVPLFLLRRQWKWLWAYAGWMVLLLGISMWRFGWQSHVVYFSKVLPAMSCGFPYVTNVSLATILQCLHAGRGLLSEELAIQAEENRPIWVCALARVFGLGIYLGTLWAFFKNRKGREGLVTETAMLALVSVLVAPITWRHHYVVTLLPLLLLWIEVRREFFSPWKYVVLFIASITIGTLLPEYLLIHLKRSVLDVILIGAYPATAIILLLVSLQMHARRDQNSGSQSIAASRRLPVFDLQS